MAQTPVLIFPHSPKEADSASAIKLADWLRTRLRGDGVYPVVGIAPGYRGATPGTLVLFQKDKQIVGEAIVKEGYRFYAGGEISPMSGKPYKGEILFEPSSVRCYVKPLSLADASRLTGKELMPRFVQRLEWNQYGALLPELVKGGFF